MAVADLSSPVYDPGPLGHGLVPDCAHPGTDPLEVLHLDTDTVRLGNNYTWELKCSSEDDHNVAKINKQT